MRNYKNKERYYGNENNINKNIGYNSQNRNSYNDYNRYYNYNDYTDYDETKYYDDKSYYDDGYNNEKYNHNKNNYDTHTDYTDYNASKSKRNNKKRNDSYKTKEIEVNSIYLNAESVKTNKKKEIANDENDRLDMKNKQSFNFNKEASYNDNTLSTNTKNKKKGNNKTIRNKNKNETYISSHKNKDMEMEVKKELQEYNDLEEDDFLNGPKRSLYSQENLDLQEKLLEERRNKKLIESKESNIKNSNGNEKTNNISKAISVADEKRSKYNNLVVVEKELIHEVKQDLEYDKDIGINNEIDNLETNITNGKEIKQPEGMKLSDMFVNKTKKIAELRQGLNNDFSNNKKEKEGENSNESFKVKNIAKTNSIANNKDFNNKEALNNTNIASNKNSNFKLNNNHHLNHEPNKYNMNSNFTMNNATSSNFANFSLSNSMIANNNLQRQYFNNSSYSSLNINKLGGICNIPGDKQVINTYNYNNIIQLNLASQDKISNFAQLFNNNNNNIAGNFNINDNDRYENNVYDVNKNCKNNEEINSHSIKLNKECQSYIPKKQLVSYINYNFYKYYHSAIIIVR